MQVYAESVGAYEQREAAIGCEAVVNARDALIFPVPQ